MDKLKDIKDMYWLLSIIITTISLYDPGKNYTIILLSISIIILFLYYVFK